MELLVLAPILIPLFTAATCLLLWKQQPLQRALSVVGGTALLCATVALPFVVMRTGIQVVHLGSWKAPYGITMVADLLSSVLLAVTGLIGFSVSVYSLASVDARRQSFGFHPLLHVLLLGVCGAHRRRT